MAERIVWDSRYWHYYQILGSPGSSYGGLRIFENIIEAALRSIQIGVFSLYIEGGESL